MKTIDFLKNNSKGIVLMLAGMGLLFFGAAGAFDLLERTRTSEYVGEEVPRELIESAYAAEIVVEEEAEQEDGGEGFVPFVVPAEATPEEALPTLQAASGDELSELAQSPTPASPQGLGRIDEGDTPDEIPVPEDPGGAVPLWLHIDVIALEAPIIEAQAVTVELEEDGEVYEFVQWEAPDEEAVGWHTNTALLGEAGNTVLNGHHNAYGRVFRSLAYLQEGDYIQVYGDDGQWYTYIVANKMVLPEWNVTLEQRMENAAWIQPSEDERLTLITCWPEQSNSHRLIIVARPVHW